MPFVAAGHALFGGVDRLLALGAFGVFDRLERHLDLVDLEFWKNRFSKPNASRLLLGQLAPLQRRDATTTPG